MSSGLSTNASESPTAPDSSTVTDATITSRKVHHECVRFFWQHSLVLRGLFLASAVFVALISPLLHKILISLSYSFHLKIALLVFGIALFCYDFTNALHRSDALRNVAKKIVNGWILDDALKNMFQAGGEFGGWCLSLTTVTPFIYSLPLTSNHRVQLVRAALEINEKQAKSLLFSPGGIQWLFPQSALDWLYGSDTPAITATTATTTPVTRENEVVVQTPSSTASGKGAPDGKTVSGKFRTDSPSSSGSTCSSDTSSNSCSNSCNDSSSEVPGATGKTPTQKEEAEPKAAAPIKAEKTGEEEPPLPIFSLSPRLPKVTSSLPSTHTTTHTHTACTIDQNEGRNNENEVSNTTITDAYTPCTESACNRGIMSVNQLHYEETAGSTVPDVLKSIVFELVTDRLFSKTKEKKSSRSIFERNRVLRLFSNIDEDLSIKTVGILSLLSSFLHIRYSSVPTRKLFFTILEVSSILSLVTISSGTTVYLLMKHLLIQDDEEKKEQQQQQLHRKRRQQATKEEEEEEECSTIAIIRNCNALCFSSSDNLKSLWMALVKRLNDNTTRFQHRWRGLVAVVIMIALAKIRKNRRR